MTPPITNAAVAVGRLGVSVPLGGAAACSEKLPAVGTLTVTTANRIDPSGQRFLTSVCVVRVPTWIPLPFGTRPWGTAWPNVAHPCERPMLPKGACASARTGNATSVVKTASTQHNTRVTTFTREWPSVRLTVVVNLSP